MVALPLLNAFNAHVLAVDATGRAVYCAAGQEPAVVTLPAPTGAAGEVAAIALGGGGPICLQSDCRFNPGLFRNQFAL